MRRSTPLILLLASNSFAEAFLPPYSHPVDPATSSVNNKKPTFFRNHATLSSLSAQIYMPDGSVVQDDDENDWISEIDGQRPPQTTSNDALLKHLNGPDMRGPLAVLAAANENIDITTIEHVNVQSVTKSAINIETICSREDQHCVNVLVTIGFPENCPTDTDMQILDALGVLHQQATAILERKELKTGTVVSFNPGRGYGFIAMDDGSGDVYVHQSDIKMDGYRKLDVGERVEFKTGIDTKRGTGKPFAFDVTPLGSGVAPKDAAEDRDIRDAYATVEAEEVAATSSDDDVDLSIPYDAAAQLAYEASDKSVEYSAFKAKYEQDIIAEVIAKKKKASEAEVNVEAKRLEATLAKEPKKDYSSMDLEERAFNILLDLGLTSLHPDPDSPDYDHSKDDEFAPENENT